MWRWIAVFTMAVVGGGVPGVARGQPPPTRVGAAAAPGGWSIRRQVIPARGLVAATVAAAPEQATSNYAWAMLHLANALEAVPGGSAERQVALAAARSEAQRIDTADPAGEVSALKGGLAALVRGLRAGAPVERSLQERLERADRAIGAIDGTALPEGQRTAVHAAFQEVLAAFDRVAQQ